MTTKHLAAPLLVTLALAAAGSASATGEPKNMPPFTRPASARALTEGVRSKTVDPPIQGEPKNEPPFTRPVEGTTIVVGSSGGFDWTDGAIGLAAGLGLALSLAGGTVFVRTNQRRASPAR